MPHSPTGSLWHRWDLHFHTPASFDYEDKSVTNKAIVDRLIGEGIRVVAITDHHTMDVPRIHELQKLGSPNLTILPGIELRSDHGGKPVHYICIFPDDCDLPHVWDMLKGRLGLTAASIAENGGDHKIYVPIRDGAGVTHELGGVVSIHAGEKSNSIEGIENREQFQLRIKYDIIKDHVDIMEIGQLKDIDRHFKIIFPNTGLDKPLVLCSDNHNAGAYSVKSPLWLRADPAFRGLLMVLHEPRDRVFIGERPSEQVRVEQNKTKYIRSISFHRKGSAPPGENWFSGNLQFNPGLVAIVGNKGSGKSALADSLGLLGATKNSGSFSFLSKNRFRHAGRNLAAHFEATIEWESGEQSTCCLSDTITSDQVERVKYLPQDHVERVCNELAGIGEGGFEQELKSVIFSHVPEAQRLGQSTLDELVRFQTGEKQTRIDSLLKQLKELSRSRLLLEAQVDPATKRELEQRIKRRQAELDAHVSAKPPEIENPSKTSLSESTDSVQANELSEAELTKSKLSEQIIEASTALAAAQRRQAVAKRLSEKLANFQKDFDVFKAALSTDVVELGLSVEDLITLTITSQRPATIQTEAARIIADINTKLDGPDMPYLRKELVDAEARIQELQSRLEAPSRAYRAYLTSLAEWEQQRGLIVGSTGDTESLTGLQASLAALDLLPARITLLREEQTKLALQIHTEKLAQAAVYRELYVAVQTFIDSHPLAKNKLKLEFRAELSNESFVDRFLGHLAQNRRGSFMGIDEGRAKVALLVQSTNWEDSESVQSFLARFDRALHQDERENQVPPVQLKDQLAKGKKTEELFDLLFGLEYIQPRYILRWEGKDLSMLSPGERGTLLLVFYLLIDKGDIPLVIDQPEGNLDNHTVAKVLVECIKEARKKRQVFVVTHNPNLAVVCDADQIVHTSIDKPDGNTITYTSGSLENPEMGGFVTDVLEGTRWAFGVRKNKYEVVL